MGVEPSRLTEVDAHIYIINSSYCCLFDSCITRRTSIWCWSALKCGQLATLSPLTLVTNQTHWTSLLLTENRISTHIITTTMHSYLRKAQSYRSVMSRTRDESISGIPVGLVGSVGIRWEWKVLLYSSVGMWQNMGIVRWERKKMKTLHFYNCHSEQAN